MSQTNITSLVEGIDKNRVFITSLMQQIHEDMDEQLIAGIQPRPDLDNPRDMSLFLILVQNYVAGFLTAECDPPKDFTNVIRFYYARGIEHGHAYLTVRKENRQ